jgi:hypothetical protein
MGLAVKFCGFLQRKICGCQSQNVVNIAASNQIKSSVNSEEEDSIYLTACKPSLPSDNENIALRNGKQNLHFYWKSGICSAGMQEVILRPFFSEIKESVIPQRDCAVFGN